MKKLGLAMIVGAGLLASCQSGVPEATMRTNIDSLSYAAGMTQARGFDMALDQQIGIDSAQRKSFFKGMIEGVKVGENKDKSAYYTGVKIGEEVAMMAEKLDAYITGSDSVSAVNKDNFIAGFLTEALHKTSKMSMDDAMQFMKTRLEEIKGEFLAKEYADYIAANEKFLADNKANDSVKVTESGLQYKVLVAGNGDVAKDNDRVKVHYRGTLIDGTEFDSSYKRKEPATFGVNQVIKGWTEALKLMPAGSKWVVYVPQELGYGSKDTGRIKPFSTLIFEVEVLEVLKADAKK